MERFLYVAVALAFAVDYLITLRKISKQLERITGILRETHKTSSP